MPDVRAQLIIQAKSDTAAATQQTGKDLQAVSNTTKDLNKGFADAIQQTTGLNLGMLSAAGGIAAVGAGLKASLDETIQWGQTIDKLSRASGESAQATSQMAVVFEDFGIKADSLDRVIRTFTTNGLQFNLATIKDLAQQYQAIQDPVARNEFAMKNFGRSAFEMNEILSKSPAELQAVGDAAMYSGKILTNEGVQSVQQFSVKTAELTDKLDGLKIAVGLPLVSALTNAIDGFHGLVATINAVDIAVEAHTGMITYDQAAARADAAAHGDLFAAFHNVQTAAVTLGPPIEKMATNTLPTLSANANASAAAYESAASGVVALTGAQIASEPAFAAQAAALQLNNDKLSIQAGLQGDLTTAMIFNTAAAGLSAKGQLDLGLRLGILNKSTYDATETILNLNKGIADGTVTEQQAIDKEVTLAATHGLLKQNTDDAAASTKALQDRVGPMGDGFGALAGQAGTAAGQINAVKSAEDAIHDKIITITTNYIDTHYGAGGPGYEGGGSSTSSSTSNTGTWTPPGAGHASGADFIVPPGYPNDSYPMRVQTGEHVTVTPAGGSGGQGDRAGAVLAALMSNLPTMMARAVRDGLQANRT